MTDHEQSMRHLPFFAELASLEEHDSAWRSVSAGLVTLRLVDAWIEEGRAAVLQDGWGMRSVEAAIEEMPGGVPTGAILLSIVKALRASAPGDLHAIAPRLMAYARALDLDAKWTLAADVYATVIAHAHPVEESDVAITAHLRLAYCERSLGALDDAAASYDAASRIANEMDDMFGVLRAQIGAAKIAIARGNLPRAEALLDETIVRAQQHELVDVHAMALQDRAMVAHLRGRYDLAVQFAYSALERTPDGADRDRLLSDIAGAFYMLGLHSVARDAYLIVQATAQEQYQRWAATINLMEIAARDGSRTLFERYRRSLDGSTLPPAQSAQFQLQVSESYEALAEPEAARAAGERARSIAGEYGFNQVLFEADALLGRLAKGTAPARAPAAAEMPDALRGIADQIGEMRRLVPQ